VKTLLLTPWDEPLKIIHWQDAVKMKYEETADVVSDYDVDCCSPSVKWKMPAVIRLRYMPHIKHIGVKFSRPNVYLRDNYTCQYCGRNDYPIKDLTYDHVKPRSKGGTTDWDNIVTCCRRCNNLKGNMTCKQAGMYPMLQPKKPHTLPFTPTLNELENAPEQWLKYINVN
jgi:5-methylcytosine-specific restriction endonuclease McrA